MFDKTPILLGIDPGYVNSGYAVVKFPVYEEPEILSAGILEHPVQDFKNIDISIRDFQEEIDSLLKKHLVNHVAVERFIGRQFTPKGKNPESISFMVALACQSAASRHVACTLISAAQWKNAFTRQTGQELQDWYAKCRAPAHPFDAFLQAAYCVAPFFRQKPYEGYSSYCLSEACKSIEALWEQAGHKLVNRRKKHDY